MTFDPGDHVVCVDSRFDRASKALYTSLPVKGREYVVRDVRLGVSINGMDGLVSLLLVGLINPHAHSKAALERGFNADRFRKVEDAPMKTVEVEETKITA